MHGEQLLKQLKRVFRYDRQSGHFHWKIRTFGGSRQINPGDIAGSRNGHGYIVIKYTDPDGSFHQWPAHRLAWWFIKDAVPEELDHKNGKRDDNRWGNLRVVSKSQNQQNPVNKLRSDNKSGHRGVSWRPDAERWYARIRLNGRYIHLGSFTDIDEAVAARKQAERRYFIE